MLFQVQREQRAHHDVRCGCLSQGALSQRPVLHASHDCLFPLARRGLRDGLSLPLHRDYRDRHARQVRRVTPSQQVPHVRLPRVMHHLTIALRLMHGMPGMRAPRLRCGL